MKTEIDVNRKINITRDDIEAFEKVRLSGETNMLDIRMVEELSGLSREKIKYIIINYNAMTKKYQNIRE